MMTMISVADIARDRVNDAEATINPPRHVTVVRMRRRNSVRASISPPDFLSAVRQGNAVLHPRILHRNDLTDVIKRNGTGILLLVLCAAPWAR